MAKRKLRVDTYAVLRRAVEQGIAYGWNRVWKYTDSPDPDVAKEILENEVMGAVCEYFKFDDE